MWLKTPKKTESERISKCIKHVMKCLTVAETSLKRVHIASEIVVVIGDRVVVVVEWYGSSS